MNFPLIDLPKLAGTAGSAVGLIIASTLLISWIGGRYVPAFDRYRALTGNLRDLAEQNKRRESLKSQINDYQRRLRCLNWATELLSYEIGFAVLTVLCAGTSVILNNQTWLAVAGGVCFVLSLLINVAVIVLAVIENRIDRRSIETEAWDLEDLATAVDEPSGLGLAAAARG